MKPTSLRFVAKIVDLVNWNFCKLDLVNWKRAESLKIDLQPTSKNFKCFLASKYVTVIIICLLN